MPSMQPSLFPSYLPSVEPSNGPTMIPSNVPSRVPSQVPSPSPTTLAPTPLPTPRPTRSPTPLPTRRPNPEPTPRATRTPVSSPTPNPTVSPTSAPTVMPSQSPSDKPSSTPTKRPSPSPTLRPTLNPTPFPTRVPTKKPTRYPTFEPSNVPTSNPSTSPSTLPSSAPSSFPTTNIPVEKLVQVCRCNDKLVCIENEPFAHGDELNICGWAQAPVAMEMVTFLQLSQYPTHQTVVQDNVGIDGGSLFWMGDLSSFGVRVVVDDAFFEKPTGMVANGRIRYSLSERRRMDESIVAVTNEEITFRLEIPLEPRDSSRPSGGTVSEATAPDIEKDDSKGPVKVPIWIPVPVVGAVAVVVVLVKFRAMAKQRNALQGKTDAKDELPDGADEISDITRSHV